MQDNPKDRRKHTRLSLEFDAELTLSDNVSYTGKIFNISFSGVFMFCPNAKSIPVGETGFFKIFIQSEPETKKISFKCKVIRTDDRGVGLQFIDIDLEGYQKFKNLMLYNSSDPDTLLAELEKHPGIDRSKS